MKELLLENLFDVEYSIEEKLEEIKNLQNFVVALRAKRDSIKLELNKENMDNLSWLLKNPCEPEVNNKIMSLIREYYGCEYTGGIYPSGYITDNSNSEKMIPIQKNFDFMLESQNLDRVKKNISHFVETFLPHLDGVYEVSSRFSKEFPPVKVVPFQFKSGNSHLDFLGYEPIEKVWYHFTLTYGFYDVKAKFASFEEAFNFAYWLANLELEKEDD